MRQPGFTDGLITGMGRKQAEAELLAFRDLLEKAAIHAQEGDEEAELDSGVNRDETSSSEDELTT